MNKKRNTTFLSEHGNNIFLWHEPEKISNVVPPEFPTGYPVLLHVIRNHFNNNKHSTPVECGSFAVVDKKANKTWLVRGPLSGIPVYYRIQNNNICAADSPLKLIDKSSWKLDVHSWHSMAKYGFLPAPLTGFEGIFKLPAGTILYFREGKITNDYWELKPEKCKLSELWEMIHQSVVRHSKNEPERTIALSGGVDSSVIAYHLSNMKGKTKAYTRLFSEEKGSIVDEKLARDTAKKIGISWETIEIRDDRFSDWDKIFNVTHTPCLRPLFTSQHDTLKRAACISNNIYFGDGGDPIFGGYVFFKDLLQKKNTGDTFDILGRLLCLPYMDTFEESLNKRVQRKLSHEKLWETTDRAKYLKKLYDEMPLWEGIHHFHIFCRLPELTLEQKYFFSRHHGVSIKTPYTDPGVVRYLLSMKNSMFGANRRGGSFIQKSILYEMAERYAKYDIDQFFRKQFFIYEKQKIRNPLNTKFRKYFKKEEIERVGLFKNSTLRDLTAKKLTGSNSKKYLPVIKSQIFASIHNLRI